MNDSLEDFQVPTKSKPLRTYLVSYSQADRAKFPSRQCFGEAVVNESNSGDPKGKVAYWACALENHANGGEHYHLSLKLTNVDGCLLEMYSKDCTISVETSDSHENYYTAYKYICKSDKSLLQSDEHPDLREIGSPKIKHCMKAYQRNT